MKFSDFFIAIAIIIILIFGACVITNYIDTGRVATNVEPKFCLKQYDEQEGKITYWGLGYKVIRYVKTSEDEPYEESLGVKMGDWSLEYELPLDFKKNETDEVKPIEKLEDIYNTTLTIRKDINSLSKDYSIDDLVKDGDIAVNDTVSNSYIYNKFITSYMDNKNAFMRIGTTTQEGDLVITDVLFYEGKIFVVTDNSRDSLLALENKEIKYKEYESINEYQVGEHKYLVAHNGELNAQTFDSENCCIVICIDNM